MSVVAGPSINLLPAPMMAARRRRDRLKAWGVVLGAYVLALGAGWGVWRAGLAQLPTTAKAAAEVDAKIAARRAESAQLTRGIADAQRALDASRSVGHHPDWSVLLRLIAAAGRGEIVLGRVDLKARPVAAATQTPGSQGYVLAISGLAPSQKSVLEYAMTLERYEVFEAVTLVGTRTGEIPALAGAGPGLVSFDLSCSLSDAAVAARERKAAGGGAP